jgi:hypothetical protein
MSEHWPPEWDDLDDENLDDELDVGELDGQNLAAVTAALASMPLPVLPEAIEDRISAAIRAEAATRSAPSETPDGLIPARSSSGAGFSPAAAGSGTTTAPPARRPRADEHRGARRRGKSRGPGPAATRPPGRGRRTVRAVGSVAAAVVLAGFGYLIFGRGGSPGPAYSTALAPRAAAASASASSSRAASGSGRAPLAPLQGGDVPSSPGFLVRETGTRYEPATLARQVRALVAGRRDGSAPASAQSAAAASGAVGGGSVPSAALAGCVTHFTGHQAPVLVDRASYAGRAAYVIAVPGRAWVVGLGCTAASPQLITSVTLAG